MTSPTTTEQPQLPQTEQSPAKESSLNAPWIEEVCEENIRLTELVQVYRELYFDGWEARHLAESQVFELEQALQSERRWILVSAVLALVILARLMGWI